MNQIDRDTLREKIERGDDFKLVMTLSEAAYQTAHIPTSIHFPTIEAALEALSPDDEIVVYCTGRSCMASQAAYHVLVANGYKQGWRYSGGLEEWGMSGYPLEGEQADIFAGLS